MIENIQKIIQDLNPNINVSVGSPLYYLLCAPLAEVYNNINNKINELNNNSSLLTATDKYPLIYNFGIAPIEGKKGTGTVQVLVNPGQSSYYIPIGTELEAIDGSIVVTTSNAIFSTAEYDIPVETKINSSKAYPIGSTFTTTLYGSLIKSITTIKEISGGLDDESQDNYLERVRNNLYVNPTTESGIKQLLFNKFNNIIDIRIINNIIYLKLNLVHKYTDSNTVNDIVLDSDKRVISKKYNLTANEINTFEDSKVNYVSVDIKEINDYITSILPIGITLSVRQASPVFVTGNIKFISGNIESNSIGDIVSFFNNHLLEPFYMYKFTDLITNYNYPVELYFNNTLVTDIYNSNIEAYYYKSIT